ncbi:helix-turn-helix domain-containing protein [Anaerosinus massiliensis]|uniref:helix-turn-helix domain-containing protein n=1 Tax=Massilibacillus massiliensis TaxID=1806837 RepID=UPI000B23D59A|nr:helix-turn-helix domain-containing protein [Massilibacillus massiliensis]
MIIAKRIVQLRTEKGYSTNKLSQLAEIGQATLREIEIGQKSPNIVTLEKICNALGITLAEFFSEDEDPNTNKIEALPIDAKKELALFKEFLFYKYGIK